MDRLVEFEDIIRFSGDRKQHGVVNAISIDGEGPACR